MGSFFSYSHSLSSPYASGLGWPWLDHPSSFGYTTASRSKVDSCEASCPNDLTERALSPMTHRANTSVPRKSSVPALVSRFENKHCLSRDLPRPISRSATTPSPFIRSRLDSALSSSKPAFTAYQPRSVSSQSTIKPAERERIENVLRDRRSTNSGRVTSPSDDHLFPPNLGTSRRASDAAVRVLVTDHSLAIHISEGVRLPIIATIRSSGSFETQMSRRDTRAGSAPERLPTSDDAPVRWSSRAATIPETSEEASPILRRTPSLRSLQRGILNISETSIPAPRSSDIVAQGEVFVADHTKESSHVKCVNWTPPDASQEDLADPGPFVPEEQESFKQSQETTEPDNQSTRCSSADLEQLTPIAVPEIYIQGVPSPEPETHALDTQATENVTSAAPESNLPADIPGADIVSHEGPVTAPAVPNADIAAVEVLSTPSLSKPAAGTTHSQRKGGKRKRILKRVRKGVFRKKILSLLLGRDIADIVHPVLNGTG